MPGSYGFLHDGCVRADDVGGHIGFFVGEKSSSITLDAQLGLTSIRLVADSGVCP